VLGDQPSIEGGGGLYDFRPDRSYNILIIINYFALQRNVVQRRFTSRGEGLALETCGVEH